MIDFKELQNLVMQLPQWQALQEKLLTLGGTRMVPVPEHPDELVLILNKGKEWPIENAGLLKGRQSNCHENSQLYVNKHPNCQVITGYALSNDGLWRQHSWVWNKKKQRVLETTIPRIKYFGYAK